MGVWEWSKSKKYMEWQLYTTPFKLISQKKILGECKFNDEFRNMANHDNITTRYTQQVKSRMVRKERTCYHHQHIGYFKSIFKDKYLICLFFQRVDIPYISVYSPSRNREWVDLLIMKKSI